MRTFIGLVIVIVVIGGFLSHRKQEPAVAAAAATLAKAQPAPPRQNYEHDWAKNSLDRATDVKRQVLQQRKENGGD